MNHGWWLEIGLIGAASIGILCVILASVHDMRQIYLIRKNQRRNRRRPHVTVLIAMHQATDDVAACIRSVRRLRYRHYDIVVYAGNDISKDAKRMARQTAPQARAYIARKAMQENILIRRAYERSGQGEMVLLLDGSQTISSSSLNHAVTTLGCDTAATGVVLGPAIRPVTNIREMVEAWQSLSQKLLTKSVVATGLFRTRTIRAGRLYRKEQIMSVTPHRITYDSKTTINAPVSYAWLPAKIGRYLLTAGMIAIVIYASVLAATLQTSMPLLLTWLAVMVWIFVTIWLDDTVEFWQRIGLTICLPLSYFAIIGKVVASGLEKIAFRLTL